MARRQTVLAAAAQLALAGDGAGQGRATSDGGNSALNALTDRQSLLSEIAAGRRRDASQRLVEPERCKMWHRHNRLYERLDERNCADLIHGIAEEGQKFPAIARKLKDDPDGFEYEIVSGARRHFAVFYLRNVRNRSDILYLIEVRSLTDEEAFQLSDVENRSRKDISDFERGRDYETALSEFYGGNINAMAAKLGFPRQTLGNYLYLARLPNEIVRAFPSPLEIAVRHAVVLTPMLGDPAKKNRLLSRAEEIAHEQENAFTIGGVPAFNGVEVFKMLRTAGEVRSTKPRRKTDRYLIKASDGEELLQVEKTPKFVTLRIPRTSLENRKELVEAIKKEIG